MFAPGMTFERNELCQQYQTTLMLAKLILTGEIQRYVSRMKTYLTENGLYKHRAKKHVNTLIDTCARLQSDFFLYERYSSIKSITRSFPIYEADYANEGESVNMKVQQSYTKNTSDKIQLIFFGYKQLFDRYRVSHGELVAAGYTIMELSLVGRDICKTLHGLIETAVRGYVTHEIQPPRMLGKIEVAVREVLSDVLPEESLTCDDSEFERIRKPLSSVIKALVDGKPVKDMLNAVAEHTFRYMDYCVVRLWMAAHSQLSPAEMAAIDSLNIDTEGLIAQLKSMPLPDEYDDVWDLQEHLPKGEDIDNTPMYDFYIKCCDRVPYIIDLKDISN